MKKPVLFSALIVFLVLLVYGCSTVTNTGGGATTLSKASYIQLGATGSLTQITTSGVASLDVVLFAFGDITTESIDSSYLTWMQTFMDYGAADAVCFLSIGGEYVTPEAIATAGGASQVVSNIVAQVNAYNSGLTTGSIEGVDLDLENGVSAATIEALAAGFKSAGLLVSIAPQVFVSSGATVEVSNPTNLVLTSGHPLTNTNTYGLAIANGYVDYIMVQAYNSGWITVNGYYANKVQFIKGIASALNNARTILSIPDDTKIFVGTVANLSVPVGNIIFLIPTLAILFRWPMIINRS